MTRQRRRTVAALALAVTSGLLLILAARFGLMATWQAQGTDFLFKAKSGESSSKVGIVAIDERSLRELAGDGRVFNWPRAHYARVITALSQAGARVIVVDVLFDSPAPDDQVLAQAIGEANIVLPVVGELPVPTPLDQPAAYEILASPLPVLARSAKALAHANVHPDGDGTVRRQQITIASQGQQIPSLALAAAARYLRRPAETEANRLPGFFSFAGRSVPLTDGRQGMLINYLGAPYQPGRPSPFPVVSFVDVLRGTADLSALRDRVVLVGLVAVGYADDYWTPPSVGRKMSGVEIHAHAIETILRPAFLRPMGFGEIAVVVLAFALLAGLGALRLRILWAAVATVGLLILYLLVSFTMFDAGVLTNMVYPLLAPIVSFGAVVVYRVLFIEAEHRSTRRLLAGYLSPSVMVEVLKDPDRLHLGGEKRTMTVLFSDIRGFTTYSEKIPPEQLVTLLNEYLTEMSAVVFEHEGVIDKYIGDGIMAFWGAPVAQEDHARRACQAALGMLRRLKGLQERWALSGVPAFSIGIGLNTGPMSVGNMGSVERFSYTVVGDAVNLAARLEGLNKLYGTTITISEATLQAAGRDLEYRFLDLVAVKGKSEPVAVYELLRPEDVEKPEMASTRQELRARYGEALRLSEGRRWQEAADAFANILETCPHDGPSAFHSRRCAEFAENPPPADWDGVYMAKSK